MASRESGTASDSITIGSTLGSIIGAMIGSLAGQNVSGQCFAFGANVGRAAAGTAK
jgi:hypothetical protein